jgi:hypothetical protein
LTKSCETELYLTLYQAILNEFFNPIAYLAETANLKMALAAGGGKT